MDLDWTRGPEGNEVLVLVTTRYEAGSTEPI